MMDKLEKVEKIREKTGVSYDDARSALEACEYDVLDAIVYLEKLGKINGTKTASYSTNSEIASSDEFAKAQQTYNEDCQKKTFGQAVDKFFSWCGKIIKKSVETKFIVLHHNEQAAEIPVLALVLLMVIAFWVTIPLLIIGLFFDFKYHFRGVGKVTIDLNDMCDKAADACGSIKNDNKNNE